MIGRALFLRSAVYRAHRKNSQICVGVDCVHHPSPYERLVNGRLQIGVLKAADADGKAAAGQQREDKKAA